MMLEVNECILVLHDDISYLTAWLENLLQVICCSATRDACYIDLGEDFFSLELLRRRSSGAS